MSFTFDLNTVWFGLVGVLLTGYAILDGFDLGIGALHLFTKGDAERRVMLNAIGPVWDGNEVWLVTGGGALFAAFPIVYATTFSGFYLAMILLLMGLIFRAVAIEFRSKRPSQAWRGFWDAGFSIGSVVSALVFGIALGNVARGVPLDAGKEFAGSFFGLLNPYALLVGVTTVVLFMMHGALYGVMKTEGELHARIRGWLDRIMVAFIVCYAVTSLVTFVWVPGVTENLRQNPILFVVPLLTMVALANIILEIRRGRDFRAFLSSSVVIATLLITLGLGLYPNLLPSLPEATNSLTIYNAASSAKTLQIMLVIAAIGMPLVIVYTWSIYRVFRGKVKLDKTSY
jgi:cytochrome bd ubiquinol oxidase subunit II